MIVFTQFYINADIHKIFPLNMSHLVYDSKYNVKICSTSYLSDVSQTRMKKSND